MRNLGNHRGLLLGLAATLAVVGGCSSATPAGPENGPSATASAALGFAAPGLVRDLYTTPSANTGSAPSGLVAVGNTVFFVAQESSSGRELWKSDGTPAGTQLVRDIRPGVQDSAPSQLTVVGGFVYFSADDGSSGRELWRTDGTAAGTVLVKDLYPGVSPSFPSNLMDFNGVLYFSAMDASHGTELWRTDGTAAGTLLVKDIVAGNFSSSPADLTVAGGRLFFTAETATTGRELWKSDGTAAGTVLVKDLAPGSSNGFVKSLTRMGSRVFFVGFEPSARLSLWTSDGTAEGTRLVYDPTPGDPYDGATVESPTVMGGTLYFVSMGKYADSHIGYELWASDGNSVWLVKDIQPGAGSGWPKQLVATGGLLYFVASDGTTGSELLEERRHGGGHAADPRHLGGLEQLRPPVPDRRGRRALLHRG
ncbi:ELWxxDGT repeat protein [Archangium gephyra]|uniref:ELWxxDGT repeat protein n=1 Tax=Archangium gephyra TaxID=48 RepID=UPI003B76D0AF